MAYLCVTGTIRGIVTFLVIALYKYSYLLTYLININDGRAAKRQRRQTNEQTDRWPASSRKSPLLRRMLNNTTIYKAS